MGINGPTISFRNCGSYWSAHARSSKYSPITHSYATHITKPITFIAVLGKPIALLARKHIDARAAGNSANRVVELIWFTGMLAPVADEAAWKVFCVDKQRRTEARINYEFAVIL